MHLKLVTPLLLVAVVLWSIYRRVRRNVGRQPVQARRLQFRIGVLAVVGALVLFAAAREPRLVGALVGGMACGALLAYVSLQRTKFEFTEQGRFYTPHTYIGLLITALFLGRVLYRIVFMQQYGSGHLYGPAGAPGSGPFGAAQRSPLTLATFGVVVGYYILFNIGVLRRIQAPALPGTNDAPIL
ncbi:MAG TPA: hypothetical protein VIX87_01840 [Steroidobacteraceae bacterium]